MSRPADPTTSLPSADERSKVDRILAAMGAKKSVADLDAALSVHVTAPQHPRKYAGELYAPDLFVYADLDPGSAWASQDAESYRAKGYQPVEQGVTVTGAPHRQVWACPRSVAERRRSASQTAAAARSQGVTASEKQYDAGGVSLSLQTKTRKAAVKLAAPEE